MSKEIYIDAPPKAVYRTLTSPVNIVRWMPPHIRLGRHAYRAWRIDVNGRPMVRSRPLKLIPDRKVMFAWGCAVRRRFAIIDSLVVISLTPQGDGTRVHLIHRKLPRALIRYIRWRRKTVALVPTRTKQLRKISATCPRDIPKSWFSRAAFAAQLRSSDAPVLPPRTCPAAT